MLILRQAYKGWEVGCVHSTLLESVMSGGESVGMNFMILIRPFRLFFPSFHFRLWFTGRGRQMIIKGSTLWKIVIKHQPFWLCCKHSLWISLMSCLRWVTVFDGVAEQDGGD